MTTSIRRRPNRSASGARASAPATAPTRAPAWLAWAALGVVYVVWGSTYLAIRVSVETMPPLLSAGVRFLASGGLLCLAVLAFAGFGALAPARFADSDAPFNLGMAVAAAQTAAPGVWIAMNGTVFDGARVRKDRSVNSFVAR